MGLAQILTEESERVADFVGLLRDERSLLTQREVSGLPVITEKKHTLIECLVALAGEREKILQGAGLTVDADGLRQWMSRYADETLRQTYIRLRSNSSEAKQLGIINARLLNQRLKMTQQALVALSAGDNSPPLYDPLGLSSSRIGYKLIDSA